MITQPTVTLGPTQLMITYVNTDELTARIPAGTAPGVYRFVTVPLTQGAYLPLVLH